MMKEMRDYYLKHLNTVVGVPIFGVFDVALVGCGCVLLDESENCSCCPFLAMEVVELWGTL
jgi:hypothetical protein